MALQITIVKSPEGVPLSEESKTFTELGGTIGRGAGNSWVLSDPERFLSSRHCEISCEAGQYFLTDLSTNGTFVNDSPEPVGKGSRVPLRDGDTFELGDYRFALKVQPDNAGAGASPFDSASPFDFTDQGGIPPASSSPFAVGGDIFGTSPDPLPLSPEPEETDPLAALDKLSGAGGGSDFGGASNYGDGGGYGDSSGYGDGSSYGQSFGGDSQFHSHHDGADALNQSVQWPESAQQNVIPEDWEDDFLGGGSSSAASPAADPLKVKPSHKSIPLTDPPVIPQQNAGSGLDAWLEDGETSMTGAPSPAVAPPVVKSSVPAEPPPTATPKPKPKPTPPPSRPAAPPKAAPVSAGTSTSNAGERLVEGMGLNRQGLTEQQIEEIAEIVGELVPEIVEGMMQVLRSRASIKNEFRMNITTIQPVENNPLKFSVDTGEALENMFVRKSSAYKKPKEAFREGFNGIAEHQVAIIAGIRAAFKSMMERFDPEHLEKQFDRQAKGAILPGMQKARYWSGYTEYYRNFVDNLEQSFQYLFGDEFVQAYEDQLRKLVAARKRNVKSDDNK